MQTNNTDFKKIKKSQKNGNITDILGSPTVQYTLDVFSI